MQILRLTLLHLKRMISRKSVLFITLLMPTAVMCLVTFLTMGSGNNSSDNTIYIDFVNNDRGAMGDALINKFKAAPNFYAYTMNESDSEYRVEHNSVAEAVVSNTC